MTERYKGDVVKLMQFSPMGQINIFKACSPANSLKLKTVENHFSCVQLLSDE